MNAQSGADGTLEITAWFCPGNWGKWGFDSIEILEDLTYCMGDHWEEDQGRGMASLRNSR